MPPRHRLAEPLSMVAASLAAANLDGVPPDASEKDVERRLVTALRGAFVVHPSPECEGLDGSGRWPDVALELPQPGGEPLRLALELKLYRDRGQGAGEMDRGFGQCLAYTGAHFDAALLYVVFMQPGRDELPPYWGDLDEPFVLSRGGREAAVFCASRPLARPAPPPGPGVVRRRRG